MASKWDDLLAAAPTTDLLAFLFNPETVAAQLGVPPPQVPAGIPDLRKVEREAWLKNATDFVIAVGAELDARVPPRRPK